MKNATFPQETDLQRQRHLSLLAASVLTRLNVPFTRRALRNTVEAEYHAVTSGGTVHAEVTRTLAAVDRRDSTNGLIVLSNVLRRYHVRGVVGEAPMDRRGVPVVARPRMPGSAYAASLAIADRTELAAEPAPPYVFFYATELSGEEGFPANARIERLLLMGRTAAAVVAGAVLLLGFIALSRQAPGLVAAAAALSLVGLLLSGFLVAYELDPEVSAWAASHGCESGKLRMSCRAVLGSPASKLFGVIPLADAGAVYFAAGAAWLLAAALMGHDPDAGVWFWYALAALPLSIFAVAYQAAVVRAWCPLCLGVHCVLWMQAAVLLLTGHAAPPAIAAGSAVALALWTVVFGTIQHLLRRVLLLASSARALTIQKEHWTRDGELFKSLFAGPPAAQAPPAGAVSFGGGEAGLLAVLSAECAPCRLMLEKLLRLHDWFDGGIAVTIVLSVGPLQRAALRLSTASRNDDAVALIKAWFHAGPAERAGLVDDADREPAEAEIRARLAHAEWLRKHRISMTPMLFFNGRVVPDEYHDLILLGEMIEDHREPQAITGVASR
jgi:uncharacterized membrane protein